MLDPGDFVLIDQSGRVITGRHQPSSERWMHIAAYSERTDVMAAIHAHPPATVLTVAGLSMSRSAPCRRSFSHSVRCPRPPTPHRPRRGAVVVRDLIKRFDAARCSIDTGSITVGKTVRDAFFKLEKLEHGCHVMLMAHQLRPGTKPAA